MKYVGSKSKIIKEILPIILKDRKPYQYYVEPFAGGMNSISEVDGNRIANDSHPYLIAMWKEIISGWIPTKITREEYKFIRDNKDEFPAYLVGWVGFCCSYSGIWFGGFSGETKTKIGTIRDYQREAIKNVITQAEKLSDVTFHNKNYYDLELPPNSIVYCDPPYQNTKKYLDSIDHDHFWEWVREISKSGHTVFVSEYAAPDDFECIWSKEVKSSMRSNGIVQIQGAKVSTEKLFKLKD